jgi:hypothetical protein
LSLNFILLFNLFSISSLNSCPAFLSLKSFLSVPMAHLIVLDFENANGAGSDEEYSPRLVDEVDEFANQKDALLNQKYALDDIPDNKDESIDGFDLALEAELRALEASVARMELQHKIVTPLSESGSGSGSRNGGSFSEPKKPTIFKPSFNISGSSSLEEKSELAKAAVSSPQVEIVEPVSPKGKEPAIELVKEAAVDAVPKLSADVAESVSALKARPKSAMPGAYSIIKSPRSTESPSNLMKKLQPDKNKRDFVKINLDELSAIRLADVKRFSLSSSGILSVTGVYLYIST